MYKTIIMERDYNNIKSLSNIAYNKLNNIADKIINSDLSTIDIIDLFNDELKSLNVQFDIGTGHNYAYPEEGIYQAFVESNGDVTIEVADDWYDIITDRYHYVQVLKTIKAIIVHELTHVDQIYKSNNKLKLAKLNTNDEYLSNIHEIQSHANEAMQQYIELGYNKIQIIKLLKNPDVDNTPSPTESTAFYKYFDYYYTEDDKIWKRFIKYCIQFLNEL